MDHLTILAPDGTRRRFDLQKGEVSIGRASAADLVLQDAHVSKVHASIRRTNEGYVLRDLQSSNGTFVNERLLAGEMILKPGDRIRVGRSLLILNPERSDRVALSDSPFRQSRDTVAWPVSGADWSDPSIVLTPPPEPAPGERDHALAGRVISLEGGALRTSGEVVAEVNRRLFALRPLPEMLDEVMQIAAEAIGFERGVLLLIEDGELRTAALRVPRGEDPSALRVSGGILDHVRRNREAVLTVDAVEDERFATLDSLHDLGVRSVMCVPLLVNDDVIGLVYVDSRRKAGVFQEHALRLLTLLANLAAGRIQIARLVKQAAETERMQAQLDEAAKLQRHFLPGKAPEVPGYEMDGSTFPCFEVGGDYFDYIALPDGRLALVLADVAGKGLSAALLMSSFQASIRLLAPMGLPVAELAKRLNRHLCDTIPSNKYITCVYAVLDPRDHTVTYVSAGHVPALLVRQDGTVVYLGASATLPLGCLPEFSCTAETVSLEPGETLVCYSDGVTEAPNSKGVFFEIDRLTSVVRGAAGRPPVEIVNRVLSAVDEHGGNAPHQDDITIVALRRSTDLAVARTPGA